MRALVTALLLAGCGVQLGDAPMSGGGGGKGDGPGGGDPTVRASCEHVDVVIAVDNSGSMAKEQQALRDVAFPAFASALRDVAAVADFRVGVLDACSRPASFHTRGRTTDCRFAGGRVWMDASSPALESEFSCVANIDSRDAECSGDDDDEQPVTAATAALEAEWAAPGKPNAGFLRDDAMLVVVAITDEDEQPVPDASAQRVYDRLVALKGDASEIVFLGAGGASDCEGPYGPADDADTLQEVAQLFRAKQRGAFSDLCQGGLEQGMRDAVATLAAACE
jgi:hypothetical protein